MIEFRFGAIDFCDVGDGQLFEDFTSPFPKILLQGAVIEPCNQLVWEQFCMCMWIQGEPQEMHNMREQIQMAQFGDQLKEVDRARDEFLGNQPTSTLPFWPNKATPSYPASMMGFTKMLQAALVHAV